ncbi:MAG TPA: serine/threonine-protein kinase, partial [Polyangiaceae bacterium]|nr:serine/threonine-protein kinase [Polyangiaceae bacterium]
MARKESDLLQEVSLSDIELTQARDPAYASHPEILSSPTSAASPQGFASGSVEAVPASGAPRVGRYELLLEIASGGMATVYIGRQFGAGGFERLVAIKRMHPHVAREPELAASFMDEARIASLIRHPNVVNVHDVHDADGEHLLVMDYVEGASLASVMRGARKRNERISRPAALRILVDALQGLHAAHEQCSLEGRPLSIVHRDATPHNILLGVDGSVRLTDFGIAKAAERSVNTAAGLAKGKFRYMAPEQARGGALDRRVDVFAMGIVAWELLTGARLFDAEGDGQVLLTITAGDYRKPTSVDPTIPADLEGIVMRALGLQPNDRYSSAQAFADAITAWGKQAGELASPSDVARLVHEFCGTDVSAKRKSLGEVLA